MMIEFFAGLTLTATNKKSDNQINWLFMHSSCWDPFQLAWSGNGKRFGWVFYRRCVPW